MGNQTNKLTKTFQTVNNFFRQPNFFPPPGNRFKTVPQKGLAFYHDHEKYVKQKSPEDKKL